MSKVKILTQMSTPLGVHYTIQVEGKPKPEDIYLEHNEILWLNFYVRGYDGTPAAFARSEFEPLRDPRDPNATNQR